MYNITMGGLKTEKEEEPFLSREQQLELESKM
jgi:hypothetical protein